MMGTAEKMAEGAGLEPATPGIKIRCSAAELTAILNLSKPVHVHESLNGFPLSDKEALASR